MDHCFNLRHLHAVVQACRFHNMRLTAQAVHLSKPATTQGIRKLELHIGAQLFERSVKGLTPTKAGEQLAFRVERAIELLGESRRILGSRIPPLEFVATTVQLRAIVEVYHHCNYSLAARALGVSQPSLHRAVADFQRLCGKSLFRAMSQGVEPSPVARDVARSMSLALIEIKKGIEDIRENVGLVDGQVAVGCLPLAGTDLLPAALTTLLDQYPALRVRVMDGPYDELLHALRYGNIDIIIGALRLPPPTKDIKQEVLFSDPLSIIVRPDHPLLNGTLDAKKLSQLDWVVPREGTPTRSQLQAFFGRHKLPVPKRIVECSSLIVTRGLLRRSDRVGVMSAAQVRQEVETGQLRILPFTLAGTERPIGVTTRTNWRPTIAMTRFLEILRARSSRIASLN